MFARIHLKPGYHFSSQSQQFSVEQTYDYNMCIQVQANLSIAELEASDAITKYWLRTQNTGRIIGESCGEKIWFTLNVLYYQKTKKY